MVLIPKPELKKYRLYNGTIGTEYEALLELIKYWEIKKQEAEDMIEQFHRQLQLAEGHPHV